MDINVGGKIIQQVMLVDPSGATQAPGQPSKIASSGDVAAAVAAASLAAVVDKTNYLTGILIQGTGATAASVVLATVSGLEGGTLAIPIAVVAGANLANQPVNLSFARPLKASGPNVAITVSVPSLGAGNTHSAANIMGFVQ